MKKNSSSHRRPLSAQRGASALLIIAVIVIISGLSVYVGELVTSVGNGYTTEFNLLRGTQAAEAGVEWGRYRMVQNGAACVASQAVVMPGSLQTFTVTLRCVTGGTDGAAVQYRLTATACNLPLAGACPNTNVNPGADYVEARATALVDR